MDTDVFIGQMLGELMQLSDFDLERLLLDLESDRVERKKSFKGDVPKKARQAVCAFANDLPNYNKFGVLFIGANDDGSPSSEPITDALLRSLSDMRSDGNILPLPAIFVEKRKLLGAEMAVVTVLPSDMPPVKYDGRIWIRTGPRRAVASEQEERILSEKRRYKNIPFDITPVGAATIKDLSKVIFEEEYLPLAFSPDILAENGRSYEERLASCRMVTSPSEPTPTVLSVLALGRNPQAFFPGAYVQFLRIDGDEVTDAVIDEAKVIGSLSQMLRRLEEKISAHNRVAVDVVSAPTHTKYFEYPPVAIQQIVYNAVLHRTYEHTNAPVRVYWFNHRIEISNPGGPYGNVTHNNFGTPGITDYRNPNIADAMKVFGFVQSFGRGIALAKKELAKNGNPPLEFSVSQQAITAILRKATGKPTQ